MSSRKKKKDKCNLETNVIHFASEYLLSQGFRKFLQQKAGHGGRNLYWPGIPAFVELRQEKSFRPTRAI